MAAIINWLLLFALVAIVFFIWRSFNTLAASYGKVPWHFGILGVAVFILGIYVGSLLKDFQFLKYARLPFGLFSAWAMYQMLKNKWEKTT